MHRHSFIPYCQGRNFRSGKCVMMAGARVIKVSIEAITSILSSQTGKNITTWNILLGSSTSVEYQRILDQLAPVYGDLLSMILSISTTLKAALP